ncbi:MAG TPA: hypothetical protein VFT67_17065 [Jatrophihabitantaceae bacterium]|nr:hypothetical protein [Jatrophihabitantaceae bacterium]
MTFTLITAGACVAVVALRGAPLRVARHAAHPGRWLDAAGADAVAGALAATALWLLAAWVAVGLLAALAGRLPGAAGVFAQRIAAVALPRALYRAAVGAAGLGVLLSPAVASAAAPHPGGTASAAASIPVPSPLTPTTSLRAPQLPVDSAPVAGSPAVHAPAVRSGDVHPPAGPGRGAGTPNVTVRPGDSLWRIAAAHLGRAPTAARVAGAWPRWFAANRAVIGADPDLLVPGEVLHAPHSSEDQR